MPRTAIVSSKTRLDTPDQFKRYIDPDSILSASRLSSSGQHFDVNSTSPAPANLYAALNPSYKMAFVLSDESARLLQTDFTVCWLATLMLDMGPGSELFIEICKQQIEYPQSIVNLRYLTTKIPSAGAVVVDDNWIRLRWSPHLSSDVRNLRTIYSQIHNSLDDFIDEWLAEVGVDRSNSSRVDQAATLATHHYRYSLTGANVKSFLLKRLINECFGGKTIRGFDMAGGFGFMAAELAAAGHTFGMLDFDGRSVNVGRRFLEKRQLTSRLTFQHSDVRDIKFLKGEFDIMSCFEALYAIRKNIVPEVFREAMKLLTEGGILVVKEGSFKEWRRPDEAIYDTLFEIDELIECLERNAGKPEFYDHITGHMPRGELSTRRPFAAFVRKRTGASTRFTTREEEFDGKPKILDQSQIWPEAVIDQDVQYQILTDLGINDEATATREQKEFLYRRIGDADFANESHAHGLDFNLEVAPEVQIIPGPDQGGGFRVLNPEIRWSSVDGTQRYRLTIFDKTRGMAQLMSNPEVKENFFKVPLKDAFSPGHTYVIKVQAGSQSNWGVWSEDYHYRVAGTGAGTFAAADSSKFNGTLYTKSPRYAQPALGVAGGEITAIAECFVDANELRQALRPYFAASDPAYRDLIHRIRELGYTFKRTGLYTPDDLGKPLAFVRYDIHVKDIVGAYGVINANLDLNVPSEFHLTWELTPYERAYARDFWNLQKLTGDTDLIHFGFHTNPIRSWLVGTKFNADVYAYNEWDKSGKSTCDFTELAQTGECCLGSYDDFVHGGEEFFYILSHRFKKYFPESRTLSGHGDIRGLIKALHSINQAENPAAWQKLWSLEVNSFTSRKELYDKAGYVVNHKEPSLTCPAKVAWLYDPIKNGEVLPEKWRVIENATKQGKTLFFYIHPSTVYTP